MCVCGFNKENRISINWDEKTASTVRKLTLVDYCTTARTDQRVYSIRGDSARSLVKEQTAKDALFGSRSPTRLSTKMTL